jgi:alpha-mannosidase/mannosylglycerate hydrolase
MSDTAVKVAYEAHVVSHTHWDREWYRPFENFRFRLVRLVDRLVEILDADPEYRYFMLDGQTIVIEDYLEVRPAAEEALRRHVQSGRLQIGPWYILPDEFLVSGEATIRNMLIGQRVARRFGAAMQIGYIPDTFGHIPQMPQILRGFGLDTAVFWRGPPARRTGSGRSSTGRRRTAAASSRCTCPTSTATAASRTSPTTPSRSSRT